MRSPADRMMHSGQYLSRRVERCVKCLAPVSKGDAKCAKCGTKIRIVR